MMSLSNIVQDEKLFQRPPDTLGDCPICMLRMPTSDKSCISMPCCGYNICSGCFFAPVYDDKGMEVAEKKCPFCNTLDPTSDEDVLERIKKRVSANDVFAIYNLGLYHSKGDYGFPQNQAKALELWHRAAELGNAEAYCRIGYSHEFGEGVEVDKKKAVYYYELAAMGGDVTARYFLGCIEEDAGNMDRSLKHHMIAVRDGCIDSLDCIKGLYSRRDATKDDYATALNSYQEYLGETKSKHRDLAWTVTSFIEGLVIKD